MKELSNKELKSINGGWAHLLARVIIAINTAVQDAVRNPDHFMEGYNAARGEGYKPTIDN